MKSFDKLFFTGPMSLGDAFVANGIVHHYGDQCEEIHVPVRPEFYKTLSCLYQDHPHVKVVALGPYNLGENQYVEEHKLSRIIRNAVYTNNVNGITTSVFWDMQMYDYYDLPFSLRYRNFRLPRYIAGAEELYFKLTNGEPYILIARESGHMPNGMPVNIEGYRTQNNLPNIRTVEITSGITENMLQFATLIERAQEIHCVPSSFFCLVDSMWNRTNAKLYYHNVRANTLMRLNCRWNNERWISVEYDQKL